MTGTALVSVADKTGLDILGPGLERLGWRLLSTGGTARSLRDAGCAVTEVAEVTGFPEILDGRVKTLHPRVFAAILAAPDDDHRRQLDELGILPIDLVVVNLYPFERTVASAGVSLGEAIEQIDIGGPSLIRAAAKNNARVSVVVDPCDYARVLADLAGDGLDQGRRRRLAQTAFRHTAAYDAMIAARLPALMGLDSSPEVIVADRLLNAELETLRYGENPHQAGFAARVGSGTGLAHARQLQGKALSFNNLGDATGAWRLAWDLPRPGVVIAKHANPCGVAVGDDMTASFRRARAVDPVSAFGGVIAATRPVGEAFAEAVVEAFAEVVVAPEVSAAAAQVFARKKNLRVLEAAEPEGGGYSIKSMDGGFLIQDADAGWDGEERRVVTQRAPDDAETAAMELSWRVVKHVSSNAIVVGAGDAVVGVGAGQMSRVDAARLAVEKARALGHDLTGTVAASDAFFPFADGVEELSRAGVTAVIQPGGSIRDKDVIEACDRLDVAMVFTGRRHFRH